MEKISNEEKAKKICANCMLKNKPFPKQLLEKELTHCDLCPSASIALKAMRWKDEQHAKEKQQLIDEVCEWIKEHNGDYISIVPDDHLTNNFYDDLRKAMKGE